MKAIRRIFSCSLFLQLLIIFLVTGLLIFAILAGSFKHVVSRNIKESVQPHVEYYVRSLILDIGTPPNIDRAKEIVNSTPVEIQITGPETRWSSFETAANIPKLKYIAAEHHGVSYARYEHDFYIKVDIHNYQYIFKYNFFNKSTEHNPIGIAILLIIISIILICYLFIKRIFKPIKWIEEGTVKFSQGNFDHEIEVQDCNELGRLTYGVNHMAQEIKKMLESKQQLLLAISHELRTPLTRTKLSLEFIEEQDIKSKISEDIAEIEELINDLLESERLSSDYCSLNLSQESIDITISETIDKYFLSKKNRISYTKNSTPPSISIDKLRIQLLLKNIINNALIYSDNNIEISINQDTDKTNQQLSISITDSGIGIPKGAIKHLTEPFYRIDPSRQKDTGGHGLGLYLCELIVKAHKGVMIFDSSEGKGTTVTIYLPINCA